MSEVQAEYAAEKVVLQAAVLSSKKRRTYRCRFVKAGRVRAAGNRESNIEVTSQALSSAWSKGLFDGRAVFIDHAGWFDNPSLTRLVGVTQNSAIGGDEITGEIKLYSEAQAIASLLDELLAEGRDGPDVGLSIVFWPVWGARDNEEDTRKIVDIRHVESVDLVFEPAADGRILEALSAAAQNANSNSPSPPSGGSEGGGGSQIMPEQPNTTVEPGANQVPAGDPRGLHSSGGHDRNV